MAHIGVDSSRLQEPKQRKWHAMAKKAKKRGARAFPKGRHPSLDARTQIDDLLGDVAKGRQHLIEHLHTLNDQFGALSKDRLAALAQKLGLAQVDVYDTASFYAHFEITDENTNHAPAVRVCQGPACRMAGSAKLLNDLDNAIPAPCQGACETAPSVMIGRSRIAPATAQTLKATSSVPSISAVDTTPVPHITPELERAGLRGMGGAGFPVAQKWKFLADDGRDRVLVVNADEGEPGTFKDRYLFETEPEKVLRGMAITAHALDVRDAFIYLRDEYPHIYDALHEALPKLDIPNCRVHLRRGAGAYVCGEESALLNSLEGKRGQPRDRPPYPAQSGYLGRPTVTHNVETLYWIADIAERGEQAYADEERPRFYSVSGRVKNPGVYRAPASTTVSQLIEMAGGMADGQTFTAFLPGGASGGIFPARFAERAMDFGVFEELGGFVGSGALVVLSDQDDVWDVARDMMDFFAHESCGKCTPCRVGTEKMVGLLQNPHENEDTIRVLSQTMQDASICGLGQAAPNPVLSIFNHFTEEDPS
ncbi:NADH-ubiquinone oxidoreductase-F iron-sulfur binding region domain-containing protein [Magnetovibrio sp. PR-2]|uniref:NADH-ubiquinone oxidoreductase-F iron-sulfur binding region domain-containing protein n=1 Tax=Magnetovibrio sp. PR-2 TaxID=3120356 RepID=UPI002FCE1A35